MLSIAYAECLYAECRVFIVLVSIVTDCDMLNIALLIYVSPVSHFCWLGRVSLC
jgi:hypothetical protein